MEIPDFWKHFRRKDFHYVTPSHPFNITNGRHQIKLFHNRENIFLTWEGFKSSSKDQDNATEVIKLDLANRKSQYVKFQPEYDNLNEMFNSYIVGSHLFKMVYSSDQFDLSIYDLESDALVKSFILTNKEAFYLKEGPLLRTSPTLDIPQEYEIETTNRIISKLKSGMASITVHANSDSTGKYQNGYLFGEDEYRKYNWY